MAKLLTVQSDTAELLAALESFTGDALAFTRPASRETADNIAREARSRLQRQLGPESTGRTVAGIEVHEDTERVGYLVTASREPFPNLPAWLEFGTRHMAARPFFLSSARLEANAHETRIRQALIDAIEAAGFETT